MNTPRTLAPALAALLVPLAIACKDKPTDNPTPTPPPSSSTPPPSTGSAAGACADGGGTNPDPVSASYFPRSVSGYCIDPAGDVRTFGDKGKLSMDEVCTTAFDGECEVYKSFGLTRVVALRYVDGSGGGGTIEINLSTFADLAGAYGMFTKRVIADGDPFAPKGPKRIAAGADAALGGSNAYVWKGTSMAELTFLNENQTPDDMIQAAKAILPVVAKAIGDDLPGTNDRPPAAALLVAAATAQPGGDPPPIAFFPKDPLGLKGAGAGAVAFYKDGDKRWRALAIVPPDVDQAKDAMKTIEKRPGAQQSKGVADDAVDVTLQSAAAAPKTEWSFVRSASNIVGVGDEELALSAKDPLDKQANVRIDAAKKKSLALAMATGKKP